VGAAGLAASAALLLAAAAAARPAGVRAPALRPLAWVPNGPVAGIARIGNRLVIGGAFTEIGPRTGQAALVDPATGAAQSGFPEVAGGAVEAVVPDGAGGWYLGGDFRYAGGLPRAGLAHVLANGAVDPRFAASAAYVYDVTAASPAGTVQPGGVTALALAGPTLYAAGTFDRADGADRGGLAAFDAATGAVEAWNPAGSTPAAVRALAVGVGAVYVAGGFTEIGGAARNGIAALDATSGRATAWNPSPDEPPTALAVGDGAVYLGGRFTRAGGARRAFLAAVSPVTGAATAWAPKVPEPVGGIAVSGGTVDVASGQGPDAAVVYAIAADGAAIRWHADADGPVDALAPDGSRLRIAGGFRNVAGERRDGAAELDANGRPTAWAPQPDLFAGGDAGPGAVDALAVSTHGDVIGGEFAAVGGVRRDGLAAIDPATGRPSSWHPVLAGTVSALAGNGTHVYLAGSFTRIDGRSRNGAAELDARLELLPWSPPALEAGPAQHLFLLPGKVVMTGYFNGVSPRRDDHGSIAAFDPRSGRLLAWGPSNLVGDGVGELVAAGGKLYATGVAAETATVVELDPRTGAVRPRIVHNEGTGDIYAAAVAGGRLYLGGAMAAVDFRYRTRLAAIDARTLKLLPWKPTADDSVFSLLARGGVVFVGGQFEHVDGVAREGLVALDAASGRLLPWNASLSGHVQQLVSLPGGFAALGGFLGAGRYAQPYLALFAT
jgi:hypothetical protein